MERRGTHYRCRSAPPFCIPLKADSGSVRIAEAATQHNAAPRYKPDRVEEVSGDSERTKGVEVRPLEDYELLWIL